MNRDKAVSILSTIQNRICWSVPVDVLTFSALVAEGEELCNYVFDKVSDYKELFSENEIDELLDNGVLV